MANISINQAQADAWLKNVKYEMDAVEAVLKNVHTALQEYPGKDDTIMQGIYKLGTGMEEKWTGMCNQFKETCVGLGKAIGLIAEAADNVVEGFAAVLRVLGL